MADFVDEIEIDKIRNTAEIFPFMAKFFFLWTLEIVLDLLYGRNTRLKKLFLAEKKKQDFQKGKNRPFLNILERL